MMEAKTTVTYSLLLHDYYTGGGVREKEEHRLQADNRPTNSTSG